MIKRSADLFLLLSALVIILLSSCETEVELLAPYDETPVIFGVLDYTADTQFVRINKTFLGAGNPDQYSSLKDSVEYNLEDVLAVIYKFDNDGDLLDSIVLEPIDIPSREAGIFYRQDVRFYHTTEKLLTESQENNPQEVSFELRATIKEEVYSAETRFPGLSVSTIQSPVIANGLPQRLGFALPNAALTFTSVPFRFITDEFSAAYSTNLRFNFDYVRSDGTVVEDVFIDYDMGDIGNEALMAFNQIDLSIFGENWFIFLGNQLDLIPDLAEVRIRDLRFRVIGSTPELNTYLEVTQPVSQFTPVLNSFSNFSNGAIGLFSSLAIQSRIAYLTESTLNKLNVSPLTAPYTYCVGDNGGVEGVDDWNSQSYLCD